MQTADNAKDDLTAQLRFESFKLGKQLPLSMSLNHQHKHSRSHSRNASISSVASLPLTSSKSTNSYDFSALTTTNSMPALASKRNSHHRRRSSVSTRHESAEIMGVSIPDLPTSSAEVSASEKDSIRRRALWALEGKQADASYSKVEIPELSTPEIEKKMFDFSSKPFAAPSSTGYSSGLNTLMANKRDSFKPSSSKDQLHTLVEEEEEEEEWDAQKTASPQELTPVSPFNDVKLPATPVTPEPFTKTIPSRPRPATLALRPLSLTPDVVSAVVQGLPTPSLTPGGVRPGLKSLSLVPNDEKSISGLSRNPIALNDASPTPHSRARPVLNLHISNESSNASVDETSRPPAPARRSSISYKSSSTSSAAGLPTPEMTPTFAERRYSHGSLGSSASIGGSSSNSVDEDFFPQSNTSYSRHRPLSVSEQHFLFKSHNALLMRIQDLEKALSVRRSSISSSFPGSRPISAAFSVADSDTSEPSDEMLRLVADLKAERDELKRDVDGWRVRVGDLEKQIGLLGKRVEGERREAWVARSRTGLLEAEKNALEKELQQTKNELRTVEEEKINGFAKLRAMIRVLEEEKQRSTEENARLLKECEEWKAETERLSKEGMITPTVRSFSAENAHSAWRRGLQYTSVDTSIDSMASSTDVDFGSFGSDNEFGFPLKAVEEEHEDVDVHSPQIPDEDIEEDYMSEEDDNGLAGYEDEEEEDMTFQSSFSSSSLGSVHEAFEPRSLQRENSASPTTSVSPSAINPANSSGSGTNTPSTLTAGSRSLSSSPAPTDAIDSMNAFKFPHGVVPVHRAVGSLSKTWTFPSVRPSSTDHTDEVDKFFNCLEDSETDSTGSRSPISPSIYTYEHNKDLFAKALESFDEDDVMPFSLPPNVVGTIVEEEESPRSLAIVFEEEEEEDDEETRVDVADDDDNDMFGGIAGIKITVTPAADDSNNDDNEYSSRIGDSDDEKEYDEEQDSEELVKVEESNGVSNPPPRFSSIRKPVPLFEQFNDGNEDVPFNFGRPLRSSTPPNAIAMSTPPRISPRAPSPSSIPRLISSNIYSSSTFAESSSIGSPSKFPIRSSSFITPPTKRGVAMPSFIPQPVSSPSPMRKGPSLREKPPVASFIRQPARKPLMAATNLTSKNGQNDPNVLKSVMTNDDLRFSPDSPPDYSISTTSPSFGSSTSSGFPASHPRSLETETGNGLNRSISTLTPIASSIRDDDYTPHSSFSSSSLSSLVSSPKLSFQTLAGFIPRSWGSRTEPSVESHDQNNFVQHSTTAPAAKSRGFVSRDKQLERLRARLLHDGPSISNDNDVCQMCDGAEVYL